MNDKIAEAGKATQFTSEKQPPNEKKRVPKYKTKLKKYFIDKGIDKIIEIADNGNLKAIEDIKEWVFGKEEQKIEHSGKIDNNIKFEVIGVKPNTDTTKDS
jgi:hypothetical protein